MKVSDEDVQEAHERMFQGRRRTYEIPEGPSDEDVLEAWSKMFKPPGGYGQRSAEFSVERRRELLEERRKEREADRPEVTDEDLLEAARAIR